MEDRTDYNPEDLPPKFSPKMGKLISDLLEVNPDKRPTIEQVLKTIEDKPDSGSQDDRKLIWADSRVNDPSNVKHLEQIQKALQEQGLGGHLFKAVDNIEMVIDQIRRAD